MGNKGKKSDKKIRKIFSLLIVIIVIAVFIEAGILYYVNNKNADKTSKLLLNQVIDIIQKNQKNEDEMMESLKEDYMIRAKAVSYIIDAKSQVEMDRNELKKIAELMSIDEIHLIDKQGRIYSGTVPKYYGYSFDSGKQISYFKPMLKNKKLTMCQDVTPNTSEGKKMMYAITWNENGEHMIQVGIKPVRLLKELKQNEIETVVNNMPTYKGIRIYVADKDSGKIYGATDKSQIGKTMDELGIAQKNKCTIRKTDEYVVCVAFSIWEDNTSNFIAILTVTVYLMIAAGCILFVISRLSKVQKEKIEQSEILSSLSEISNTDNLTGCFNRRAYEEDIKTISRENDFIYISMDVNGLKIINDSLGHAAGDELLCGAALCMKQGFDLYGKVYRIGGDEFVAILVRDLERFNKIKEQFDLIVKNWSGEKLDTISVSCGCVSSKEREWRSIKEVANIADVRMYEEKAMYYKKNGIDRRGQPEAYVALYKLYSRIMKIDLQKDSYRILNWKENEQQLQEKRIGKLSDWLKNLEDISTIYQDDLKEYNEKMNLEYIRKYFTQGKNALEISYRKKEGSEYERISIAILAAEENLNHDQEYFLYLKR